MAVLIWCYIYSLTHCIDGNNISVGTTEILSKYYMVIILIMIMVIGDGHTGFDEVKIS